MKRNIILMAIAMIFMLGACSSKKEFKKPPTDELILKYSSAKTFSIILIDMEVDNGTWSDTYKHRYKIIYEKANTAANDLPIFQLASHQSDVAGGLNKKNINNTIEQDSTDWIEVDEVTFNRHINDLGMELVSKDSEGKISKVVAPPGFNNYVGNSQYGEFRRDSYGNSFWHFFGQYMFMRSMLGMMHPVGMGYYGNYRDNYRGRSAYYGSGGRTYGTRSPATASASRTPSGNSFKGKVNNQVARSGTRFASAAPASSGTRSVTRSGSAAGTTARSGTAGRSSFKSRVSSQTSRSASSSSAVARTSRSSSRYSGGTSSSSSSSRSRSSGSRGGK
ncbi:MAG: hypothetical protein JJT94_05320 [Bernardetiaceae bacterium]|nr:hypothetical protein [Bernardetiaceae bacterium]